MNQDPDGIAFFTGDPDPNRDEGPQASVFGAVPTERLDQMLRIDSVEEIGSPFLPEADEVPTAQISSTLLNPVALRPPNLVRPALAVGTYEWRRDFILNGPAASTGAVSVRTSRRFSGHRAAAAALSSAYSPGDKGDS